MFPNFPWTNFHRLNADWILQTVQNAVDTVTRAVERIESALSTVDGLTRRVTNLETATRQLQEDTSALQDRLTHSETQITTLQANLRQQGSALDSMSSTVSALSTAVADKAQMPVIINLSAADAFPAHIPAADQAQVRAALTALNTGTGAAQAHIEQQADRDLPAAFNIRLSYAGDGILTGILSQTIYDGNAYEYLSRITTVSVNSSAMTWEMGSQTVKPGMEYMLRYNLQTLTPEAKRQARANISAAYTEDVEQLVARTLPLIIDIALLPGGNCTVQQEFNGITTAFYNGRNVYARITSSPDNKYTNQLFPATLFRDSGVATGRHIIFHGFNASQYYPTCIIRGYAPNTWTWVERST